MQDKEALSTCQVAINAQESSARPVPVGDPKALQPLDNPQGVLYSEKVLALLDAEC
jgi:hypothetical protein